MKQNFLKAKFSDEMMSFDKKRTKYLTKVKEYAENNGVQLFCLMRV